MQPIELTVFIIFSETYTKHRLVLKSPRDVKAFLRSAGGGVAAKYNTHGESLQLIQQACMDIVKSAIGHDQEHIPGPGMLNKKADNLIRIGKVESLLAT